MPKMKSVPATPEAKACRQAMVEAMRPYVDKLGPQGTLAVASALVGQLIALQDQRVMTPKTLMEIVARNIEAANQDVIAALRDAPGGSA